MDRILVSLGLALFLSTSAAGCGAVIVDEHGHHDEGRHRGHDEDHHDNGRHVGQSDEHHDDDGHGHGHDEGHGPH